jgi:hypothetical protein
MKKQHQIKYVHEGDYVAEIEVVLIETDEGWSPYLSLDDAHRLDEVRAALQNGDLKKAAQYARIYKLTPVTV